MTEQPDHELEELRPDHDRAARPEEEIADAARTDPAPHEVRSATRTERGSDPPNVT
ncbi:MAG TPA: hypothetical protein VFR74_07305 [Jiangellales bacterium]|nr:hypothetical protein [Jiangellales bacterium]